jgi:flagellum-specific peptidoglycan hydrolase FlgJ
MSYTAQELDQIIFDTAIDQGYNPESAKFVVAQARLESQHYSSNVFNNNNNMFGMSYAGQKLATKGTIKPFNERDKKCQSTGVCANANYYAKYNDPSDCIKDRLTRYGSKTINNVTPQMLKDALTAAQYAKLLKLRGYYTAPEIRYAKDLQSISTKLKVKKKISHHFINFSRFIDNLFR